MESVIALGAGALFGVALEKSKTNVPFVVSGQMELKVFIMMRMFLAALATSTVAVWALDYMGVRKRQVRTSIALGFGIFNGLGGNVLGGFLLGSGMYLSGSCPGTLWSQLGSKETALWALFLVFGGITGTLIYGYLQKYLARGVPDYQKRGKEEDACLVPKSSSYTAASAVLVFACVAAIQAVEFVLPWEQEMLKIAPNHARQQDSHPLSLQQPFWDPAMAGVLVGLLQLPLHLTTAGALGMSGGLTLVSANLANLVVQPKVLEKHAPFLYNNRQNHHAWTQVLVGIGALVGTMTAQAITHDHLQVELHPSVHEEMTKLGFAFLGSLMQIIGARIQAGCTSGHGLSGLSTLSLASLVSVGSMFAGGMLSAAIFHVVFV